MFFSRFFFGVALNLNKQGSKIVDAFACNPIMSDMSKFSPLSVHSNPPANDVYNSNGLDYDFEDEQDDNDVSPHSMFNSDFFVVFLGIGNFVKKELISIK